MEHLHTNWHLTYFFQQENNLSLTKNLYNFIYHPDPKESLIYVVSNNSWALHDPTISFA